MASAAAAPVSGQVVQRFRARLREAAGEEEPGAAAVVGAYEEVLAELTFNCKPIITELTIIAEQHAALAARGIAGAISARIVEVVALPPSPRGFWTRFRPCTLLVLRNRCSCSSHVVRNLRIPVCRCFSGCKFDCLSSVISNQ
jgi:pre-mRNA cleavage complex 2 protein Pcf11